MVYGGFRNPSDTVASAQCLYLVVSLGSPEAMEQFNQSEIGTVTDADGTNHPVFIDGWGNPICWLRWAPGYSNWTGFPSPPSYLPADSDIQTGYAGSDPDPFDPRGIDYHPTDSPPTGFHLIPLICSAGPDGKFGLNGLPGNPYTRSPLNDPYAYVSGSILMGSPVASDKPDYGTCHDNITNHHIEQR